MCSVLTTDMLVEGVHFDLRFTLPREVGEKALAVNLSDLAAMAGVPRGYLVALGVSPEIPLRVIDELYSGLRRMGVRSRVALLGGDTVASASLVLCVTVWGEASRRHVGLRSGARVGDLICVTGDLGGSAAGFLWLSTRGRAKRAVGSREVARKHLLPVPRLRESIALSRAGRIRGLIDISDGLAADLGHVCEESRVGAIIREESLPVAPSTRRIAGLLRVDPVALALHGGEDYELLFTMTREDLSRARVAFARRGLCRVTVIGEIVPSERGISVIDARGRRRALAREGFDHFRRALPVQTSPLARRGLGLREIPRRRAFQPR
jgi:thiamine-monophosphate kinase